LSAKYNLSHLTLNVNSFLKIFLAAQFYLFRTAALLSHYRHRILINGGGAPSAISGPLRGPPHFLPAAENAERGAAGAAFPAAASLPPPSKTPTQKRTACGSAF